MNSWLAVEILVEDQNGNFPPWSTGWQQLLGAVVALVLTMFVLLWLYHSMQTPRLFLTRKPPAGRPGVTWESVLRYVVLTPILIFIWYAVLLFILTVATNSRTAEAIAVLAAAVVGAARVLSHVSPEGSHELGKTVPLAVLSVIILGGGGPSVQGWGSTVQELVSNGNRLDTYYFALVALDVVVTAIWFMAIRWHWEGQQADSQRTRWRLSLAPTRRRIRQALDFGKPAAGHLYRIAAAGADRDASEPIERGGADEPARQEVRSS